MAGGSGGGGLPLEGPLQKPLVVTQAEAQEMNARVRDILEDSDCPHAVDEPGVVVQLERVLSDPRPLALQIIRAIRDLQSMGETSILVSEEECWFLERRFRHNDREPVARTLLMKIHTLLLEFHPELAPLVSQEEEVETFEDKSYREAIEDADENSGEDTSKDAESEQGTGDTTVPTE